MKTQTLTLGDNGSNDADCVEYRDRKLDIAGYYDGLPFIGILRPVYTAFESGASTTVCSYSDMTDSLTDDQSDLVRNAMEFEQYNVYINLSRVSLNRTHVSHQVLMASGTEDHAVCITVGIAQGSDLTGSANNNGTRHFIRIAPVLYDFRRETAYWASKYKATDLHIPIDGSGVRFSTMSKFEGYPVAGPPCEVHFFSAILSYDDEVPVYDGRPEKEPFNSSAADYKQLETWPRYVSQDVPDGAVVIVGYSVTGHGGDWPLKRQIALNIQFVIILVD